ncbi:hypothetical protein TrVFT333_011705 [Trichoderma virens FT-333]|nr:hypothetical protein TrVFT333_011705 [Trichoderma virens FT-333]
MQQRTLPTLPTPPTEEEREFYYYGLPSRPIFIARSSTQAWVDPRMPGTLNMCPRVLQPVGEHPLLHQLWNNAASSLRAQILQSVSAADWTAVDILRVGLNGELHITLMVAVKPDTLSWSGGYAIAMECKSIFEAHNIHEVDCEIRESLVNFCRDFTVESIVESTTERPATFQLSSAPILDGMVYAEHWADMSDCLGTKIAMKHMDDRSGAKGLYLSLQASSTTGEPKLLALTCRHVVIDSKTEGLEKYSRQELGNSKDVIQIDQPTYLETIKYMRKKAKGARNYAKQYTDRGNTDYAASFTKVAKTATTLGRAMEPFVSPSSRVFGQLLFSPELTCITDPSRGSNWLRDWALIELLPECHQAPLCLIQNKVYVGPEDDFERLLTKQKSGLEGVIIPETPIVDGCIKLEKDVVTMDEILSPSQNSEHFVWSKGGLTLGLGNTLVSILRHAETLDGDGEMMSEEWAIVPIEKVNNEHQAAFSTKGDSGSCVWDMKRRPAGILSASASQNRLNDITYVQPLERLLADIKSCGFEVSLV